MCEHKQFLIQSSDEIVGMRLDAGAAELLEDYSRSQLEKAISAGALLLNGKMVKARTKLKGGDSLSLDPAFFRQTPILPEPIPLTILYEDDDMFVVNKPAGMITHPTDTVRSGTLVNALLASGRPLATLFGADRPGIVHRLDAQTSGALLIAKNDVTAEALKHMFQQHLVKKRYLAIVEGNWQTEGTMVDKALGRNPKHPEKQAVRSDGRNALSRFITIEAQTEASFMAVDIATGRTHQIRVHAAYCSHPVVGDTVYGFRRQRHAFAHHLLHARRLSWQHPHTGQEITVVAPLDYEFLRALSLYGFHVPLSDDKDIAPF